MSFSRTPFSPPNVPSDWNRRAWLTALVTQAGVLAALAPRRVRTTRYHPAKALPLARPVAPADPTTLQGLAQQAVQAAQATGAQYADARLTRTVEHRYLFDNKQKWLSYDAELVGVGVRALVNGYWGFAAAPLWIDEPNPLDVVVGLAHGAVTQATINAKGPPRTVALGQIPVASGHWATPVQIDPFTISIEEKLDQISYWQACALRENVTIYPFDLSHIALARQERVLATSDGTLVNQTIYESGGDIKVSMKPRGSLEHRLGSAFSLPIAGLENAGKGWELFLEAQIPDQLRGMEFTLQAEAALRARADRCPIGRYTLVCDGATMAAVLSQTLGVATQLDRALGYEANAGGTSFLDDPLGMLGQFTIASPLVTVTANRTVPSQLATVQWDDEGVVPQPFTLVHEGRLADFQTTRESAAWLAPAYERQGEPVVRAHGCAAAEDARFLTLQHTPNLALAPSTEAIRLNDLISDVKTGILIEKGGVSQMDFQARNGLIWGYMRRITNGRLGARLDGGTVMFETVELWKHVTALGGSSTQCVVPFTQYQGVDAMLFYHETNLVKGQPPQRTSHSSAAVAATLVNQPIIDLLRKA